MQLRLLTICPLFLRSRMAGLFRIGWNFNITSACFEGLSREITLRRPRDGECCLLTNQQPLTAHKGPAPRLLPPDPSRIIHSLLGSSDALSGGFWPTFSFGRQWHRL